MLFIYLNVEVKIPPLSLALSIKKASFHWPNPMNLLKKFNSVSIYM